MATGGSPTTRKQSIHQADIKLDGYPQMGAPGVKRTNSAITEVPMPLTTSKLANQPPSRTSNRKVSTEKQKLDIEPPNSPIEKLMAFLNEQTITQTGPQKQKKPSGTSLDIDLPSSESIPATPGSTSDRYITTPSSDTRQFLDDAKDASEAVELFRLRKELEETKSKMVRMEQEKSRMEQELHQRRLTVHDFEHDMSLPAEAEFPMKDDATEDTISHIQTNLGALNLPTIAEKESWNITEDATPLTSGQIPECAGRNATCWAPINRPHFSLNVGTPMERGISPNSHTWSLNSTRSSSWYSSSMNQSLSHPPFPATQPGQCGLPNLRVDTSSRQDNQLLNEPPNFTADRGKHRGITNPPSRPNSAFDNSYNAWSPYTASASLADGAGISPPLTPLSGPLFGPYPSNALGPFPPRPIGTRLSPTAAEFNVDSSKRWNSQLVTNNSSNTYVPPVEPMNYRRLLDRNMSCNWKYIVDKIVGNNDQQASIFLQQKLKVGTSDQKYEIVDAIIQQAIPLMTNRFGNFLVQRCFEHGTQEQVVQIARAIRGNTLMLSMDAFGCHVIQKAFDCVPEEYKAIMVHELLRRIPETVIHRYACHVWQKLFELRWSDSPPQIMKYVNEALRGMWHEVALGETGSLVVQNIFENCLEEDKRPCINEVLASIDVIAHGQFGNWCIQHICEHGAPADRNRAIDHILRFATEYSVDQYASKVIEKCLKIGGSEFLDRYLERVCEGRPDRPRMPLIDIAGDQFGNYLIQYILMNASPQHREVVASHVRKHMVSLRGSKYGSRVAMLCCNPAIATRPGPPAGIATNRFPNSNHTNRGYFGGAYR